MRLMIRSPRDSTGGLGVKMVEYVLGGSPTNKESPLDSRLRNLKIDEVKVRREVCFLSLLRDFHTFLSPPIRATMIKKTPHHSKLTE
jgi:hypothetical protein